jgi:hypothetical protein
MNAGDVIRAGLIGAAVAVPVAVLLALLWVSMQRREPIPWGDMWRALTRRGR